MTEPIEDKISALRGFLEDMEIDANTLYNHEDRLIDNSGCTSRSYYIESRAANEKELDSRLEAIEKIKNLFGIK